MGKKQNVPLFPLFPLAAQWVDYGTHGVPHPPYIDEGANPASFIPDRDINYL